MQRVGNFLVICAALWAVPVAAQDLAIAPDLADLRLVLNGQEVVIARVQDASLIAGADAPQELCPPRCVQPMSAGEGVDTLGALEVMDFLQSKVAKGAGLLLDVRLPDGFAAGHVPGAVNVPSPTLGADNPYLPEILMALGAQQDGADLVFDAAMALTVYGDGPAHDEARLAVQALLAAGYPAERIEYFRGGMQEWLQFGLTVAGQAHEG